MPQAVRFNEYGDIDVLEVVEVPRPVPGAGQVLVEVKAAAINPGEAAIRGGAFADRWPATFPSGQGSDLAGVVAEVGPGVTRVAAGDEVIGVHRRPRQSRPARPRRGRRTSRPARPASPGRWPVPSTWPGRRRTRPSGRCPSQPGDDAWSCRPRRVGSARSPCSWPGTPAPRSSAWPARPTTTGSPATAWSRSPTATGSPTGSGTPRTAGWTRSSTPSAAATSTSRSSSGSRRSASTRSSTPRPWRGTASRRTATRPRARPRCSRNSPR